MARQALTKKKVAVRRKGKTFTQVRSVRAQAKPAKAQRVRAPVQPKKRPSAFMEHAKTIGGLALRMGAPMLAASGGGMLGAKAGGRIGSAIEGGIHRFAERRGVSSNTNSQFMKHALTFARLAATHGSKIGGAVGGYVGESAGGRFGDHFASRLGR